MIIESTLLVYKAGGASGEWQRERHG